MLCLLEIFVRDFVRDDTFNESVSIYVVQGNHRVCVERVESTQPLRRVINIGDRLTLTRGASGRLLLAYLDKDKIKNILREDPYTTEEELKSLCHEGYALSRGEREEDVTSIYAPIFNVKKQMIAALAMSGPSTRFPDSSLPERIAVVKEYARRISEALGYQP